MSEHDAAPAAHTASTATADTAARAMTFLTGGFGALNGSHCPGIERLTARVGAEQRLALHHGELLADVPSPSWIERDGDLLYATLENTDEIATLRIGTDPDSGALRLTELSRVPSRGSSPTHAAVAADDTGRKHLIVANYMDGHVSVLPIADDGSAQEPAQVLAGAGHGPLPAQEGPHAHWALPLPDGRVLTTDLGADRIYVHHWNDGELVRVGAVRLAPGTGPRDMHLLPMQTSGSGDEAGWRVAVVDEWGDTVTLLGPDGAARHTAGDDGATDDADGIRVLQTIDLGGDASDQAASLAFVPWQILRGQEQPGLPGTDAPRAAGGADPAAERPYAGLVYVGLRGSERIVALSWDGVRLARLAAPDEPCWSGRGIDCGGRRPRHILAVGGLLFVANEVSDRITVFAIGPDGAPTPAADMPSGSPTVVVRL